MSLKRGRYATFCSLVRSNLLNRINNSARLLIIFLVLGVLFISSITTSNAQEKRELYDLSNFPEPFIKDKDFHSKIVLGERAIIDAESSNILFEKLKSITGIVITYSKDCPEGSVCTLNIPPTSYLALDNEPNILSNNVISIGGPCANKITAQIMNLPNTWPGCANGFENGVGRLIVYNKWNKTQIVVAGYSADDTKKSAEVLANHQDYNLSGAEVHVFVNKSTNFPYIYRPYIEQEIIEAFKTNDKQYVIITLQTSNETLINEFIGYISNDFETSRKGSSWVSGTLSRKGFERIKSHPLVDGIVVPKTRTIQNNE